MDEVVESSRLACLCPVTNVVVTKARFSIPVLFHSSYSFQPNLTKDPHHVVTDGSKSANTELPPSFSSSSVYSSASGKRVAHFARGDGIVDKSVLVARGVSSFRRDEPAILLDAARTSGGAGVRRVPFHLSQEVGERAGGAERSAV